MGAIAFKDFKEQYRKVIPEFIFETVNELLFDKWNGEKAIILQEDIISSIKRPSEYEDLSKNDFEDKIYARHWLDFEESYRSKGWRVKYYKPSYNENFRPYFEFKELKNGINQNQDD